MAKETIGHEPTALHVESCVVARPLRLPVFADKAAFGRDMKGKHFFLDPSWTFINHGAFGASLKEALEAGQSWKVHFECQAPRSLEREVPPHLVSVSRRLAAFVDADPENLVLLPNVTTAMNTVVQSLVKDFRPGASILTLSVAYGATKKLLQRVHSEQGVHVKEVSLTFPIESDCQILQLVEAALTHDIRLAIFDHIPSNYGIILPIKDLVFLCHQRGVEVLVDGAHALGALPISMRDIDADYYVSNAHKWFCSAKGCAFLHVARRHQPKIHPLIVSRGAGSGFSSEFVLSDLSHYSPYLSLNTVIDFWEFYGVDNIRSYIHGMARTAALELQRVWGTALLSDLSHFGAMVLVALPEGIIQTLTKVDDRKIVAEEGEEGGERNIVYPVDGRRESRGKFTEKAKYGYEQAEMVQNALYHQFRIEVPVKAIQGKLYVRISAHVYNSLEDYQQLARSVLLLCSGAVDSSPCS